MKSLKIAGLCLASMLVMGMALAGNAAAAGPLWLLCLEGTNAHNTKYEDSSCTKPASGGSWESVPLGTKTDTVRIRAFTLRLRDKTTALGESEIECGGAGSEGKGTISSENKGQITEAKVSNPKTNCTRIKGGCKAGEIEEVKGVNLPWNTAIVEKEGKFLTQIENSGPGEPGWAVKCNTLGGKKTDECTSESKEKLESTELINEVTKGTTNVLLVRARFEKAHNAKCSEGGKEAGQVEGLVAILLNGGGGLSINPT